MAACCLSEHRQTFSYNELKIYMYSPHLNMWRAAGLFYDPYCLLVGAHLSKSIVLMRWAYSPCRCVSSCISVGHAAKKLNKNMPLQPEPPLESLSLPSPPLLLCVFKSVFVHLRPLWTQWWCSELEQREAGEEEEEMKRSIRKGEIWRKGQQSGPLLGAFARSNASFFCFQPERIQELSLFIFIYSCRFWVWRSLTRLYGAAELVPLKTHASSLM